MSRLPLLLFAVIFLLSGCHGAKTQGLLNKLLEPAPLRVGIVNDAPPLAYSKDGALTGLEPQFAAGLAESLERRLELVALPQEGLIPALREKKIDLIMAGMTVAEAQKHQLAATTPYFLSGQTTLVRLSDYDRLGNGIRPLTETPVRLGVVTGGTADVWLKGLRPKGAISRFESVPEGVQALIKGTIDVFISNLPANFYYAALYVDRGLTPGSTLLTKEELAWVVRPGDDHLREAANKYLAAIEQSGELQKMLDRAIPFYRNTAYSPKR